MTFYENPRDDALFLALQVEIQQFLESEKFDGMIKKMEVEGERGGVAHSDRIMMTLLKMPIEGEELSKVDAEANEADKAFVLEFLFTDGIGEANAEIRPLGYYWTCHTGYFGADWEYNDYADISKLAFLSCRVQFFAYKDMSIKEVCSLVAGFVRAVNVEHFIPMPEDEFESMPLDED